VPLEIGNSVALFLTAWLIYLADRFVDASSLNPRTPRSLRQDFCLRHREIWIATVALVAGFDAYVIWRTTAWETFLVGAVVGLLALLYLVLNQPLGLICRALPAKEIAIGILFAAGTAVALLPRLPLTPAFAIAIVLFAALCALNCISIANWERDLDRSQRKVSIATRHPSLARQAGNLCLVLGLGAFAPALVFRLALPLFVCMSVSAFLLAGLSAAPSSLDSDQRTALADLVLFTPFVLLVVSTL